MKARTASLILAAEIIALAMHGGLVPPRAGAAEPTPAVHVCYALDDSASMWMATDMGAASDPGPDPLRYEAAKGAVALLGADVNDSRDAVSFVMFGSATSPGEDIVTIPLTPITSNEIREQLSRALDDSAWSKGYTRIDKALEACRAALEAGAVANASPPYHEDGTAVAIVLLTDGGPASDDPAYDGEAQVTLIREHILPVFKERGWPVYVVAFGQAIKEAGAPYRQWMDEVAQATGGQVTLAESRSDLLRIYTQLTAELTGRVYQGEPVAVSGTTEVSFEVEHDVERLNVTAIKSDPSLVVHLLDPSGNEVIPAEGGVVLTSTRLFESYTVPDPVEGTWRVVMNGEGDVYFSAIKRMREPSPVATPTPSLVPEPSPSPTPIVSGPSNVGGGGFPLTAALLLGLLPAALLGAGVWWRLRPRPFGYLVSDAGDAVVLRRLAGRGLGRLWPRSVRLSRVFAELGLTKASGAARLEFWGDQVRVAAGPKTDGTAKVFVSEALVRQGPGLPVEDGERILVAADGEQASVEFRTRRAVDLAPAGPVQLEMGDDESELLEGKPQELEPAAAYQEASDGGAPVEMDLPSVELEFVD